MLYSPRDSCLCRMEDLLTDISKGNRKHMTLSDRIIIEQGLNQQMTFKSIAASIEKDPSSISKEIRRYLLWSGEDPVPYKGNDCVHYKTCTIDMLCMWDCSGYCKDCNPPPALPSFLFVSRKQQACEYCTQYRFKQHDPVLGSTLPFA